MPFELLPTELPDVTEVRTKLIADDRGAFAELFQLKAFPHAKPLTQVNYSRSKQHVLRGLHYQMNPSAQAKLVVCLHGEVFDVAVDIRNGSPTYGKWVSRMLSAENNTMLFIPAGFAHGFCVTSAEAEVIYFCDEQYAPNDEGGVLWNDPALGITWPTDKPLLADRDAAFPPLAEAKNNFTYE